MTAIILLGSIGGLTLVLIGVNRYLKRQIKKRRAVCEYYLERARMLSRPVEPREIHKSVDRFRYYCKKFGFTAADFGTDSLEMSGILNSVSRRASSANVVPIDIGVEEDEAYTGLEDDNDKIEPEASNELNIPELEYVTFDL